MVNLVKEEALRTNIPIISDEALKFIINYIKKNNVKNILEIGSATGYSAICFAEFANVTTIERDEERYLKALDNIKLCKLQDKITIYNIDALEYSTNKKYDLIFIDAAKSKYIEFFNLFKNNLNIDGAIITDNLLFHGMVEDISLTKNKRTISLIKKIRKYIDFLNKNEDFNTIFYQLGDGLSVSKKIE